MSSTITVLVNGNPVNVIEGSLRLSDRTNQRRSYQFTIRDDSGTALYKKGQPVQFNDSVLGTVYSGFLHAPKANNLTPNLVNLWTSDTVDMLWLADKRSSNSVYTNQYSGVIVGDQVQQILAGEGVWANMALDYNHQLTDWTAGGATLAGVQATSNAGGGNPGDGDLELAPAGSEVTFVQQTQADFAVGSHVGLTATSNGVTFTPTPTIKLTATESVAGVGNGYIYVKIWDKSLASYTIPSSFPTLFYDIWIPDSCPQQMAGIDLVFTDGTVLHRVASQLNADAQGLSAAPSNDLSGLATNQWYHRILPLYGFTSMAGKTLSYVTVVFEGDNTGNYTVYVRNISISNFDGSSALSILNSNSTAVPVTPQILSSSGYSNMTCTLVTAYERHGAMASPFFDLSGAGICRSSFVGWDITVPTGNTANQFTFLITASVDGGATFLPCTLNGAIPALIPGMNLAGKSIVLVYVFDNASNDPTLTPVLTKVAGGVLPSYSATKSDSIITTNSQAGWLTGTLTNLVSPGPGSAMQLNGYARNWDDANYGNQTLYGTSGPSQGVLRQQFFIAIGSTPNDARSRLDFAGSTWQNFTAEVDVVIPAASVEVGFVYRTTGWQGNNDTYAYSAWVSTTQVSLAMGTNSSSGAGSFTSIATASVSLTAGDTYHLKIVINGNSHQIYLDDVLYVNATDSTYPGAGYLGLRIYNSSGVNQTATFDNFGVVAALSGTWVSPAIDIHSLGTILGSQINLQIDPAVNASMCTFLVEISLNNGSTWTVCPNSQSSPYYYELYYYANPVPGLTVGTNVGSMTQVKIRITISSSTASTGAAMPDVTAVTLWAFGSYSSTGTWTSPSLSLAGVGRAGASLVNWNDIILANTSLTVKTSVDGGTSYQIIATPGSAIPNLTVAPSPFVDTFSTNTSAAYTSTNYGSGANGTWTWDTANSRLIGSGGTNAVLQYGGAALYGSAIYGVSYYGADPHFTQPDMDVLADFNWSDGGGLFVRMTDANHLYYAIVNDASASSNPNTLRLFKYVAGVVTQLGTTQTIAFTRGSYVRVKLDAQGTTISVSLNGTQLISVTDSSITGAGVSGFLCGTKIQAYSLRVQPYGQPPAGVNVLTQLTLTSTDPTATPQVLDVSTFVSDGSVQIGNKISAVDYRDTIVSANIDDQNKKSNGWWTILASKQLIFQQQLATPAPWCLQSVADPNAANIQVAGLSMENGGDLYRNRQKLKGVNATQTYSKQFTGDGKATSWALDFPVAANTTPTIKLNSVVQIIGVQGIDTGKAFYYMPGGTSIQQDASGTILQSIDTLEVDYLGSTTVTVTRNNTGQFFGTVSQAAYKAIDGTSGIVEQVLDVSQMNMDVATAQQYGDQLLQRYGVIGRIFTFMTLMSGLAIGQQLPIFLPCFSANNVQTLITQVDVTEKMTAGGVQYWYSCVATEGPALDSWNKVLAGVID